MSEPKGAIFFWPDEPHITGYLVIGDQHYELAGVRRSAIRADLKGRKIPAEKQTDLFDDDDRSGESAG